MEWEDEDGDYSPVPQKSLVGEKDPHEGDRVRVRESGTKKIFDGIVLKKGMLCRQSRMNLLSMYAKYRASLAECNKLAQEMIEVTSIMCYILGCKAAVDAFVKRKDCEECEDMENGEEVECEEVELEDVGGEGGWRLKTREERGILKRRSKKLSQGWGRKDPQRNNHCHPKPKNQRWMQKLR